MKTESEGGLSGGGKRTSRRIIPSIVKGGKKETIGKDSISRLIRWLNYAEDLAKIASVFRKAHVKTEFQGKLIYNVCVCVCIRINLESFERRVVVAKHTYP